MPQEEEKMTMSARLAAAAGMLEGCGWKDSSNAVLEARTVFLRATASQDQQVNDLMRLARLDFSQLAAAGGTDGIAAAIRDALLVAYVSGAESARRNIAAEETANGRRLAHIERHWFDSYPGDPRNGVAPHLQWAFSSMWEYTGTNSLAEAADNEIRLMEENRVDEDDDVGEPVITAADMARVAHLPADEVLPDSEGGEI